MADATYNRIVRLVGNDTIKINGKILNDFPHADIGKITFATELATVKTGKNQNAIFASNESGNQATLELKVLRGSTDDTFLNNLLILQKSDLPSFVLLTGELVKRIGRGNGTLDGTSITTPSVIDNDTYILTSGIFTKMPEVTSNVEGDVEQAVTTFTMQFAVATRKIA